MDVRQLARELGVKYVLGGSGRCAADRVRINPQLNGARAAISGRIALTVISRMSLRLRTK